MEHQQIKHRNKFSCSAKLTVSNALDYLHQVERVLSKDEFSSFLEVIEDFKQQRITTKTVVSKVKSIFDGKPKSLTTDFNMFLPPEYHIRPEDSIHPESFSAALQLVKKIRERFLKTQPKVLSTFIEILGKFQNDHITLMEARIRVRDLFKGQTDLLVEFDEFLPAQQVSHDATGDKLNNVKPFTIPLKEKNAFQSLGRGNMLDTERNDCDMGSDLGSCTNNSEKRKFPEAQVENVSHRPLNSDGIANKRRLLSVSKLHSTIKKGGDGQNRDVCSDKLQQSSRKFQQPQRLSISDCNESIQSSCRKFRVFQREELVAVLPQALLQRVHSTLKSLHSSSS